MQGPNYSILPITLVANGTVAEGRFVQYDGSQCGDGDNSLGVSFQRGADQEAITVDAEGIITMVAGGVIPQGAEVQSNADGLPVASAAGAVVGRALDAAIAGERVRIRLLQN